MNADARQSTTIAQKASSRRGSFNARNENDEGKSASSRNRNDDSQYQNRHKKSASFAAVKQGEGLGAAINPENAEDDLDTVIFMKTYESRYEDHVPSKQANDVYSKPPYVPNNSVAVSKEYYSSLDREKEAQEMVGLF
jgi:hypothetical protein